MRDLSDDARTVRGIAHYTLGAGATPIRAARERFKAAVCRQMAACQQGAPDAELDAMDAEIEAARAEVRRLRAGRDAALRKIGGVR